MSEDLGRHVEAMRVTTLLHRASREGMFEEVARSLAAHVLVNYMLCAREVLEHNGQDPDGTAGAVFTVLRAELVRRELIA